MRLAFPNSASSGAEQSRTHHDTRALDSVATVPSDMSALRQRAASRAAESQGWLEKQP